MAKPPSTPFLKTERQNTDHSLTAERDKTNESLVLAREKTETRTDKSVDDERAAADLITLQSRAEADANRKDEFKTLRKDQQKERQKSDERLIDERQGADEAIEKERSRVDLAMARERDLKATLITTVLSQDRVRTDINLQAERAHTDSAVFENSDLLNQEIAQHSKTKVTLTSRDEFLAIVSHDLRNPIGTASSCAEMLLKGDTYKVDPEIRPWIELIKRNVDISLRLISDILDMERVAEDKLELKKLFCSVDKILHESVESFTLAASARNVLLKVEPSEILEKLLCDRDRITQVLSNLVGNALKFTPTGGSIILSATQGKNEVLIHVSDSGPGIPEEKRKFIFNRFAQLGSKDRTGLGLGLYISKMLVEAHQGHLWVHSKVNQGSQFSFSIPQGME
ncbi:MAG: HAMP domain-containing histidine kinase [Bdellovibrionaceae bacterium]|nr:HAMP domain-containing histidine kinase [Pseudobdellovibrionaceae bacterium]